MYIAVGPALCLITDLIVILILSLGGIEVEIQEMKGPNTCSVLCSSTTGTNKYRDAITKKNSGRRGRRKTNVKSKNHCGRKMIRCSIE